MSQRCSISKKFLIGLNASLLCTMFRMRMTLADLLTQIVQHRSHSLAAQAGAQQVSQPPDAWTEPLSVISAD